jgi:hypothetical protein
MSCAAVAPTALAVATATSIRANQTSHILRFLVSEGTAFSVPQGGRQRESRRQAS